MVFYNVLQFSHENMLVSFINKIANLKASKETPKQVLSCEYCTIFKNTVSQCTFGGCSSKMIKFYKDIYLFFLTN